MKVAVLGGGVIGVTTAWYLAAAGHEVVVIERRDGPARETSYANAGEISPGYASPWAAPGIPAKAIRWLMMRHAPLILQPRIDSEMLAWLLSMLRNCTGARYRVNKARMVRLADYSKQCLAALREDTGIRYDDGRGGTLQLFRTQKQLEGMAKDVEVLRAGGIDFEILDRAGCLAVEPGLSASTSVIAGGLRLPGDETGDCFKFTSELARMASARGVTFHYETSVSALLMEGARPSRLPLSAERGAVFQLQPPARADGGRITGVQTERAIVTADAYVIALGSFSSHMVRPLGLALPVYPVKGYSITLPVRDPSRAPVSTLMDETYKIAITRLGERIRVGGMAEISGYNSSLPERRRETLLHSLGDLFPGGANLANIDYWSGLRPMTPDGTPIIGATPVSNLFLNTGHGTLGWTMACGSARALADIIGGDTPDIETGDLSIARY